ncbi:MAG: transporter substrate-binding domain-containing protein, partial [Lachnospiraceae bacterium]|nr:transporter substrate-binding domain-containing protein [Lachnospiraceae bacterium]
MKKTLRRIAGLALAAVTIFAFAGCGGSSAAGSSAAKGSSAAGSSAASGSSAATATGGELKVGMEADYAPFNWTQMDNKNNAADIQGGGYAGGYDVMIAQKIAEGLGMKLVVVKTEWDGLSPALTSGKIDMIIAGMSPTTERK